MTRTSSGTAGRRLCTPRDESGAGATNSRPRATSGARGTAAAASYLRDQGRFFYPKVHFEDDRRLPPVDKGTDYYATDPIADHAIRCLREYAETHPETPFFHYLAFTALHFPFQASREAIARFRRRYPAGWDRVRAKRWRRIQEMGIVSEKLSEVEREVGPPYPFPAALEKLGPGELNRPRPWSELTGEQREFQATKIAIHGAMIDVMDRAIRRVIEPLRKMGALDETFIVFLSDNGASAEIMVRDDGHDPGAPPGSGATYLCLGPGGSTCSNTPFRRHKTRVHEGGSALPPSCTGRPGSPPAGSSAGRSATSSASFRPSLSSPVPARSRDCTDRASSTASRNGTRPRDRWRELARSE